MANSPYALLTELESLPYFDKLLTSGIIPVNWLDYKCIYETYKIELSKMDGTVKSKRQAKTNTAEEFNISEAHVYRIVKMMGG